MINFKIEEINKKFALPEGRHEISYGQWTNCFEQLPLIQQAQDLSDAGKMEEAEKLAIEYSAKIISYLSDADYEDVLKVHPNQLANLFNIFLTWMQDTTDPKQRFKIRNRYFEVPVFGKATAGEYMDVMSLLGQIKRDDDIDRGLVIASIYCREKDKGYTQNLEEIEERKQFFKQYAKVDLFYSCAFFLRNSLRMLKKYTLQPLDKKEVEKLTSTLSVWDTIHCLLLLQKQES